MIVEDLRKDRTLCPYFDLGMVKCYDQTACNRCEFGDRMRQSKLREASRLLLFCEKDVLRQTEKAGGDMWWTYPIVLREETMDRLGLERNLFFQIAVADGGPGVFLKNPVGEIDCHLFVNESKRFTITRKEAYGIPNENAVRKFDETFFMNLRACVNRASGKKGGWCL